MTVVDWERYRQCPVCGAPLGEPCASMVAGYTTEVLTVRDRPHSTRKLRAESSAPDYLSPCRREIVDLLALRGETSLEDLTERLARSKNNVCHDLRFLRGKQLVSRRYEGQRAFYRAVIC